MYKKDQNTELGKFQQLFSRFLKFIHQIRQKHLAFIFFVFLSIIAWLIRALSDTYIADIEYPVKYTNLPPNKILSAPPLDKLSLQVQSDGYTILSSRFKYKRPLSYNLNAFALYSLSEDSTSVYTLTRYAKERLSTELNLSNKDIQILDINPDTLIFNFSRVKKKRLPIKVVLQETPELFERQYMLNGEPYSIPDSVDVTGPSFIVDTLDFISTQLVRLSGLSDTIEKKVSLHRYNRLDMPIKKTKIIVPVDEFTESEFSIPIEKVNVPDSVILKTFPSSARIKYNITLTQYDKVRAEDFYIWVDYANIDPNASTKLEVEMDAFPKVVHNVKLVPGNVEFLIEIKNEEDRNNGRDR